ncbi:MAG: OprO/OprP family phosphate-selective porin [Sulfurimonas sp.]|nr:OprO/OprP family phosphate-selective porin [Sulfurimonas sp.]
MKKILLSSALCATLVYGTDVLPAEKRTFDQSKFIPDISLIMDASYVDRNVKDDAVGHLEVPGVAHGLLGSHSHGGDEHSTYNAQNGFNLNYAELVLSSSVDPFFTMDGVFHFSEHGAEIEELFFTSNALGHGARVKGGKFNSNFGYLNEQHHHAWDFADMPLVYEAFLGMHGLNEKGAQLQWTAPTPFYLMAGFEVLQGENEQMFGKEEIDLTAINAVANPSKVEGSDGTSLYVGYLKASHDFGNTTLLGGLSYAQGESRIDHSDEGADAHAFGGDAKLCGADFVVLHQLDSYKSIKWQSEYLQRELDGIQYANNTLGNFVSPTMLKKQSGLYSQLIYKHDNNWRVGARYDTILKNDVTKAGTDVEQPNGLDKYTAMVEYHTSEFARFRLQYSHDNAMFNEDGEREKIDTIILQANISIGAHAAHSF